MKTIATNMIELPDGHKLDFPLVKENFCKFRLIDSEGSAEGPWFWCHPEDKEDYNNNVSDNKMRYGVAANHCLAGLPWGAVFPYTMNGDERPKVYMATIIEWASESTIWHPECLAQMQ